MTARQTFWSRRKQAVEAEARREEAAQAAAEDARVQAEQARKTDEEVLQELGLPDPDTLQAGDDFSGFMAKAVPSRLRNRALRKLWQSNPVLANLDGLVDYGEDFTGDGLTGEVLQTSYQVGRGLMKHVERLAGSQDRAGRPAEPDAGAEAEETPDKADPDGDTVADTSAAHRGPGQTAARDDAAVAPPKRRMRFVAGEAAQEMAS